LCAGDQLSPSNQDQLLRHLHARVMYHADILFGLFPFFDMCNTGNCLMLLYMSVRLSLRHETTSTLQEPTPSFESLLSSSRVANQALIASKKKDSN